ncbi:hypothetical protein T4B_3134 [Trichinella pseudospiralis]|uniref:Uncharacterized protein n=1 Tax=Trichinella pseudospiralis TaxID=6337 RepID=A0A0V1IG35_TRIPS|nr:hypothetical protein T4B_3134 [Trichinella pseudospiralis]
MRAALHYANKGRLKMALSLVALSLVCLIYVASDSVVKHSLSSIKQNIYKIILFTLSLIEETKWTMEKR